MVDHSIAAEVAAGTVGTEVEVDSLLAAVAVDSLGMAADRVAAHTAADTEPEEDVVEGKEVAVVETVADKVGDQVERTADILEDID